MAVATANRQIAAFDLNKLQQNNFQPIAVFSLAKVDCNFLIEI